ncbi:MAG TPA: hypothetical protein VHO95_02865, partial [Candidatus Dormibacteraeota bacterium]|nr:hypothetical protein [Candidatus Dormibacteraeota bacterium]
VHARRDLAPAWRCGGAPDQVCVMRWRAFRRVPWIWSAWERIYLHFLPVIPVGPGSLFGFRRNGDVLELHFDGRVLSQMRREAGYTTHRAVRRLRDDLAILASRVRRGELGPVKRIKGISLMGEAGAILGFETREMPRNFANTLQQYFMVGLDAVYHPRGLRERAKLRWPVEVSMSVERLLERYPEKSSTSTAAL